MPEVTIDQVLPLPNPVPGLTKKKSYIITYTRESGEKATVQLTTENLSDEAIRQAIQENEREIHAFKGKTISLDL